MFFYIIGIVLMLFFLFVYFLLKTQQGNFKKIATNIVANSEYRDDIDFFNFYVANSGVYYSLYSMPLGVTLWVTVLSAGMFVVLLVSIAMIWFDHYITGAIGILEFGIIMFTDTITFFSFRLPPEQLIKNMTAAYLRKNTKASYNPALPLLLKSYDSMAHEITTKHFRINAL